MAYTVPDFASAIREKYPGSYDAYDDKDLAEAIIEKHPEYKDQVTFDQAAVPPEKPSILSRIGTAAKSLFTNGLSNLTPEQLKEAQTPKITPRQEVSPEAEALVKGPRASNLVAGAEYEKNAYLQQGGTETPEAYAERTSKSGAKRNAVIASVADVIAKIQDATTVPLASLIFGHTTTERMGQRVLGTRSALDEKAAVASIEAKPQAERTDEDQKILKAADWKTKLGEAVKATLADPQGAGKELLIGLIEESPTYILTSAAGGEVLKAAGSLYKGARAANRLRAVEKRVAQGVETASKVEGAANPTFADESVQAASRFNAQEAAQASVKEAEAKLVKPSTLATAAKKLPTDIAENVAAGEVISARGGKEYGPDQLVMDLTAAGLVRGAGIIKDAMKVGRLSQSEFNSLVKIVSEGIDKAPNLKDDIIKGMVKMSESPDFADARIRISNKSPTISYDDAVKAYGQKVADAQGWKPGDQIEIVAATGTKPVTRTELNAAPEGARVQRGEIALFTGADASALKEEATHFMQNEIRRRAAAGNEKMRSLQERVDDWEQSVRSHAEAKGAALPAGDELLGQAYAAHRGAKIEGDVGRVAIPDDILKDFDELFGKYNEIGSETAPTRDITGKGFTSAERTAAQEKAKADLAAREGAGSQEAFAGLPAEQQALTPDRLKPAGERPAMTKDEALARAVEIEKNPLAPELLPEDLRGLSSRQKNSPSIKARLEEIKQANLAEARRLRGMLESEFTEAPAGRTVTGPERPAPEAAVAPETKTPAQKWEDLLARAAEEERGVRGELSEFTVSPSGEARANPTALPAPRKSYVEPSPAAPEVSASTVGASAAPTGAAPEPKPAEAPSPAVSAPVPEAPVSSAGPKRTAPRRMTARSSETGKPISPTMPAEMTKLVLDGDVVVEKGKPPYATTEKGARALYHESYFDAAQGGKETPVQYRLGKPVNTKTPEFHKWFGDSKVVDDKGEPLVVYRGEHGLNDGDIHSRSGSISFGSKEAASLYAEHPNNVKENPKAPRVTPAYIKIENPAMNAPNDPFIELGLIEKLLGKDEAIRIAKKFSDDIENTNNWQDDLSEKYATVEDYLKKNPRALENLYFDAYKLFDDPEEVGKFRAAGFDGAIHAGSGATAHEVEYKVFKQNESFSRPTNSNSARTEPTSPRRGSRAGRRSHTRSTRS